MKYINLFKTHASYESEVNGGVDISLPNVSYCEDVKDVHYNPYNTVEFYVGEVTEPQTVSIYTDKTNHVDVTVSEGSKWYSYVLPKDKGLLKISGNTVNKVFVKADINTNRETTIIPRSTVEASFKGSDTSKVTDMSGMFKYCSGLTSLDVSSFDTSNVTQMYYMFYDCSGLESLTLSNFDTSNVTNMSYMFWSCSGLTSLDVSSFNTNMVTNMSSMFQNCANLESLDLSNFDTSKVTDMSNMFLHNAKLSTIKMVGCSKATIDKIKAQLTTDGIINNVIIVTE